MSRRARDPKGQPRHPGDPTGPQQIPFEGDAQGWYDQFEAIGEIFGADYGPDAAFSASLTRSRDFTYVKTKNPEKMYHLMDKPPLPHDDNIALEAPEWGPFHGPEGGIGDLLLTPVVWKSLYNETNGKIRKKKLLLASGIEEFHFDFYVSGNFATCHTGVQVSGSVQDGKFVFDPVFVIP